MLILLITCNTLRVSVRHLLRIIVQGDGVVTSVKSLIAPPARRRKDLEAPHGEEVEGLLWLVVVGLVEVRERLALVLGKLQRVVAVVAMAVVIVVFVGRAGAQDADNYHGSLMLDDCEYGLWRDVAGHSPDQRAPSTETTRAGMVSN